MLQYASLDEAWQASPAIRKKKKAKRESPGNGMVDEAIQRYPLLSPDLPWTDNETDVSFPAFGYASSKATIDEYKPFPDYSASTMPEGEASFARTDAPLTGLDGPARRTPEVVHVAETQQNSGDETRTHISVEGKQTMRESDNVFDVVLYVFSGIVLILLLEQFVQMGVHLRR